jgi:hypothetical protein
VSTGVSVSLDVGAAERYLSAGARAEDDENDKDRP